MVFLGAPPIENSYYDHFQKYELDYRLFFVFGSNLAGRHGAGAAKEALFKYGAIYGRGVGYQGQSFAIPTKSKSLKILSLPTIKGYVEDFIEETIYSGHKFYVTPIGTGLAGYKYEEIAPMFKGVINCWLPLVWKSYLEN